MSAATSRELIDIGTDKRDEKYNQKDSASIKRLTLQ